MLFYFTNAAGHPVVYKVQFPEDAWTQKKGSKEITVIRSSCWMRMGAIGGVEDVPAMTQIQISPSDNNAQTIGVRYVVRRCGQLFSGFGSSNSYSLTKNVKVYTNDNAPDKEVVSGNVLHAMEMAVKRAKVTAIAAALGFDHNEVGAIVESSDYLINPNLRLTSPIGYKYKSPAKLQGVDRAEIIPAEKYDGAPVVGAFNGQSQPEGLPKQQEAPPPPKKQEAQPPQEPKKSEQPKPPQEPKKPEQSKPPQEQPKKPEPSKPSSGAQDPGQFVLPWGDHEGKALITVLSEKPDYVRWLAKECNNAQIKGYAIELLKKFPNLANQSPDEIPAQGDVFKNKLKDFWKSRNYHPKTEVKDILETALGRKDLKYDLVSEAEAEKLYGNREKLFPPKEDGKANKKELMTPAKDMSEEELNKKTNELVGKEKCRVCSKELKATEIKVSLKKGHELSGQMMCYKHLRIDNGEDDVSSSSAKACATCKKVLDKEELAYIEEYKAQQLCADCQPA